MDSKAVPEQVNPHTLFEELRFRLRFARGISSKNLDEEKNMSPAYFREASAALNAPAGGRPDVAKEVSLNAPTGLQLRRRSSESGCSITSSSARRTTLAAPKAKRSRTDSIAS